MNWAEEGFGDEGKAQASLEGHVGEDQREAGTGGQAEVGPQQQLVNQYCSHGVHPLFSSTYTKAQVRVEGGSGENGSSRGEALLGREGDWKTFIVDQKKILYCKRYDKISEQKSSNWFT